MQIAGFYKIKIKFYKLKELEG